MLAKVFELFLLLVIFTSYTTAAIDRHIVPCDTQRKACKCRESAHECEFTLLVEEIQTFTAYEVESNVGYVSAGQLDIQSLRTREEEGKPFYINNTGYIVPSYIFRDDDDDSDCITFDENFTEAKCTVPLTVDGKSYRSSIAVNGLVPGPTLIVYEGQRIVANVINGMLTETISIHWHGMDQRNTPWMDGALNINQCPISPLESFQYYFKAAPTGSFWYHSHRITQRADGLFGALIIRESAERRAQLEQALNIPSIIDDPETQTINLHEWAQQSNLDYYTPIKGEINLFPDKPIGAIPLPPSEQMLMGVAEPYGPSIETAGPDGTAVGDIPFSSGLINGKGRNKDVPYNRTRLEIFSVEDGGIYRFRLIGAQSSFAYKFSVDEHNLTVITTDGSIIEPVEAQFIILHTGERYDFLLKANKPRENISDYWIRAETLESDLSSGPPYRSIGNLAEAILHYNPAPLPRSTSYEDIKTNSIPFNVTTCGNLAGGCVAVNCPFQRFHSSYNTRCVNVDNLVLLWPTPSSELPSANVDQNCADCELFLNIGSDTDSINGRNMQLPSSPLQTQKEFTIPTEFCDTSRPCLNKGETCSCIHVREISSFNKTIRLVLSSVGNDIAEGDASSHPMHLHGHQFHVVAIRYGSYHENGTLRSRNTDISCSDDPHCSLPSWNGPAPSFNINNKTVRKDTVIVPGGGYVVIQFLSNNPGFWFLHCHIITDLLEGMAVVINIAEERHNPAPPGFPTCGGYSIGQNQYYKSIAFDPDNSGNRKETMNYLLVTTLLAIPYLMTYL